MSELPVGIEDVRAAARRLAGVAHRTPVLTSRTFDAVAGAQVHFKCENFQRGGSFKFRGAYNLMSQLSPAERERGVVAFSSGNHAQGTAYAAKLLGIPATIVMPEDAPRAKLEATRGYGARIRFYDRHTQDREAIARSLAQELGACVVPPYDHLHTIAGQGTAAFELLEEAPDLDALLVPIGGGGLMSGCATAARALSPRIRVFAVETAASNDWWQSARSGNRVRIDPPDTIADGMRTQQPGQITFGFRELVEDFLLVSEDEVVQAMRLLLLRMKILAEPTGAVAPAAALARKVQGAQRIGVVISGGNVDASLLAQILS